MAVKKKTAKKASAKKADAKKVVSGGALGTQIDRLYKEKRELEEEAKKLKKKFEKFEQKKVKVIGMMNKSKVTSVKGKLGRMTITQRSYVVVDDFDKLHDYVKKYNAWDLVPRSVNSGAVNERIENGEKLRFLHTEKQSVPTLSPVKGGGDG